MNFLKFCIIRELKVRVCMPAAQLEEVCTLLHTLSYYGFPMEWGRPLYFCPVVSIFLLLITLILLLLFFPHLISAVRDWMSTILHA